jgi:phosphoglycerate dehydrogenase-like enzyme
MPAQPPPPLVLATEPIDDRPAAWLAERTRFERCDRDSRRFQELAPCAAGLFVRTYTPVDAALLAEMPRLKVVGRAGVGLDHIDLAACRRRGVEVVHTPDANTQAVVEYVVCLLADALRPRLVLPEAVSAERWHQLRREVVAPRQMSELHLGVLGLGRIGRRVTEVARAIGMRVSGCDLLPIEPPPGVALTDVETLFAECDAISIHVDGRAGNRGIVGARLLSLARPGLLLINTSRGLVLDEAALSAHLRADRSAQALLDVHAVEPIVPENPLLGLPNAHLLPHLASRTATATENMSWVVLDLVAVLEGRPPRHPAPAFAEEE